MKRLTTFLGRYGLLLLWLTFGPITAIAARRPGFVPNPETVPYPWSAALVTWGILGVESAIFYVILRSGRGLRFAFLLAALLFTGCVATMPTDMPGYYYVPVLYQLVLTASLAIAWVVDALKRRAILSGPGGTAA